MDTLERNLPISGADELQQLRKIAVRFEEKIYTAAASQPNYLRKISLKMLSMETKSQTSLVPCSLPSDPAVGNQNPPDPGSQNMPMWNQGQTAPMPVGDQSRQPLLAQGIQNPIASAGMQNSANLSSVLPSMSSLPQNTITSVGSQSSHLQSAPGISQINWRPTQGEPSMDTSDWRSQLQPDYRQRIVNRIIRRMDNFKRNRPGSGAEELKRIAERLEEKVYTAAASQPDYLRKISLKMLLMETKSQTPGVPSSLPSDPAFGNQNPADPGSQNMPMRNQGQMLPMPVGDQSRQQLLAQGIQNLIASAGMQNSASLSSVLPSMSSPPQNTISSVGSQSSNLQSAPGISQNPGSNSLGQGLSSNMFFNSQRPMQGKQHSQQVVSQQHQQESQNTQQTHKRKRHQKPWKGGISRI